MIRFSIVLCLTLAMVAPSAAVTVTLRTYGAWPEGLKVHVARDGDTTLPEPLMPTANEVTVGFEDNVTWRYEPTFIITLPEQKVGGDTVLHNELRVEVPLSIKRTSLDLVIPIDVLRGIGNKERERIQDLGTHAVFEKLILAQALAAHYDRMLPDPSDPATKRMVNMWFLVLYEAMTSKSPRPLRVDDKVTAAFLSAFATDQKAMATYNDPRKGLIESAFWRDLADRDALYRAKDCISLRALDTFLRQRHEQDPAAAEFAKTGSPDALLTQNEAATDRICPE
ncbi:hypothetical protein [Devosia sediminis]|uniref:Uncharacterized protein n=1 Tax=Devosia sediminis TaxID=2798801 RepID=A0A934IXD2_9HYPH|nr:hypothetical protein [Devosia sediminis]MBJ3786831.1 hypothetical protein [Devosia sediminis]